MKKQIWLFTHSNAVGGAEKCIDSIYNYISGYVNDYDIRIAVLKTYSDEKAYLKNVVPWWKFLFLKKDVIHSHLFWPGVFVRILKIFSWKSNWIHTVHYAGYEGQNFQNFKKFLDNKFIFPKVNRLVFVSEVVEKVNAFYLNSQVILNSLNLQERNKSKKIFNKTVPVLACVSQLRSEKGIDDLIEIFFLFKESFPNARLKIAGDGPIRNELVQLVRKKNLENAIQFCGFTKNLEEFYEDVDIYIQPSHMESFGMATLEALSFGKPVVGSDVGFLSVLLAEEKGILVARNEEFISSSVLALKKIVDRYQHYVIQSQLALKFWQQYMKPGLMEKAYFDLYKELTSPTVCMISPIVTSAKGGLQQQLFLQSHEIKKRGFRIFVLQNKDKDLISLRKQWSHVDFFQVPQFFSATRIRGLWFIIAGFFILIKHRKEISIFHAHQLYSPTILGAFGKWINKAVLITKVTASGKLGEAANLKKLPFFKIRKRIFKTIDRVFVLTQEMKEEMSLLGICQDRVKIVSNSVLLPVMNEEEFYKVETKKILFVGRLSVEKSIETILQAAIEMQKQQHSLSIQLVGGVYPERDASQYLRQIVAENPKLNVHFLGEHKNVEPFYRERSIFVLPSSSEGMSNALLEAMSYGLICVVSDIPANQFLIVDKVNGFLFKQGDSESLANVLIKCQMMPISDLVKVGKEARKTVEKRFSTTVIAEKIVANYVELIGGKGKYDE